MTATVHASSLASVTQIASNPPDYPDVPIDGPRQPLVLYIARVPGSRDIFLTPIKPRDRIVTAEDVQSSLYYIHVNSAEDFEAPPPPPPHRPPSIDADALHVRPNDAVPKLPRRPPSQITPSYGAENRKPNAQGGLPSPTKASMITRKPVATAAVGVSTNDHSHVDQPKLPSRPLPKPPVEESEDIELTLRRQNLLLLRHSDHTVVENPYDQIYPAGEDTWVDPALRPVAGSLTLIRRDPSTHEQWNVAAIHDEPASEPSLTTSADPGIAASRSKRNGAVIFLDITNPSYARFQSHNPSDPHFNTSSTSLNSELDQPSIFRRRLHMPGEDESHAAATAASSSHTRFGSVGSIEPALPQRRPSTRQTADSSTGIGSSGASDRRGKGYVFASPWASRCEFHTGATGRSLKCRHRGEGGARGRGGSSSSSSSFSVEVSELRFNLPTSAAGRQAAGMARTAAEKRGSYLQGLHRKMRPMDYSSAGAGAGAAEQEDGNEDEDEGDWTPRFVLDEDGRIDLTLGKERAGGGFGGRQAKLGKLIVEPEGFKMLDLLVAANVGLWWRAYERH